MFGATQAPAPQTDPVAHFKVSVIGSYKGRIWGTYNMTARATIVIIGLEVRERSTCWNTLSRSGRRDSCWGWSRGNCNIHRWCGDSDCGLGNSDARTRACVGHWWEYVAYVGTAFGLTVTWRAFTGAGVKMIVWVVVVERVVAVIVASVTVIVLQ